MSNTSIFAQRFASLAQQSEQMIKRSLVDLALVDRHAYWDVEALDIAIEQKGIAAVIEELRRHPSHASLSTRVLILALEEIAMQLSSWTESKQRQRFLTLWREKCMDYGWEDMRRQAEGVLFDFRLPSLHRQVILEQYPKSRTDIERIGLLATENSSWLLDVSKQGIRSWDSTTGEEGPFWTVQEDIVHVQIDKQARLFVATWGGGLYMWDVDFQSYQEIERFPTTIESMVCRDGVLAVFVQNTVYIIDDSYTLKREIPAKFKDTPVLALSYDGQRVMACDGSILGVWSVVTGSVIFGLSSFVSMDEDSLDMVEAVLDMATTNLGLRMMDRLDIWGLKLASQYDVLRSLSEPLLMSGDDKWMILGSNTELAWVEWEQESEEFVVLSEMELPDMWGLSNFRALSANCRYICGTSAQGVFALDVLQKKDARYPVQKAFICKLAVIDSMRLIACDDGDSVRLLQFRPD